MPQLVVVDREKVFTFESAQYCRTIAEFVAYANSLSHINELWLGHCFEDGDAHDIVQYLHRRSTSESSLTIRYLRLHSSVFQLTDYFESVLHFFCDDVKVVADADTFIDRKATLELICSRL